MSNSETIGDTTSNCESKQPIGSSKRKRKSSIIKRNIVNDEKTVGNTSEDSERRTKSDRTHKKFKLEALKPEDSVNKPNVDDAIAADDTSQASSLEFDSPAKGTKEESINLKKTKGKAKGKDSGSHECVNCNFCSEHKTGKEELDEDDSKPKKKIVCEICANVGVKRVYNSMEKYKNHVNVAHTSPAEDVNRFQCSECAEPTWFPTKSKYMYHLGAKHPGIIKFICEVCTETFKLKANYKSHMNTHNIVIQKKFSCDVCNGTFVNKAGYEAHKRRFPGPHIKQNCPHCGFSFSREKHMKNHRCKKLLLEEAANRANDSNPENELSDNSEVVSMMEEKQLPEKINTGDESQVVTVVKKVPEAEIEAAIKKTDEDPNQANKRVVFHKIIPRRSQEQAIYRPVQMQSQNVPESVVVQELREIDLEGGTFIAADSDQQIILRDLNGHLVSGNQILQFDLNDVQAGEESQVYLADWNVVAPFVIREKSP